MSKSKTKKARREAKRETHRKAAANQRKALKVAKATQKTPTATGSASKGGKAGVGIQQQAPAETNKQPQVHRRRAEVPFGEYDNILLVGEGDFSFTHSIVTHHGCASVTATSYDSASEVATKYPQTTSILSELTSLTPPVPIHHSIDATKLSTYRPLRQSGPYDIIIFNFPHVGGLSTDINRQVRSNQHLLVNFFNQINASFSTPAKLPPLLSPAGKIIVTLFTNHPYTLWNIRDLARHEGLRVLESGKFDWGLYPGYRHVRTLGNVEGEGGAWKGEEREARFYVFDRPGQEGTAAVSQKKRKRGNGDGESSDSDEGE